MNKIFKFQKVMFVCYFIMLILSAIYALSFMTAYQDLFGYENVLNESVANFHTELQKYNRVIFYLAVVGAISIIPLFALEINKKVPDKIALIIMGAFSIVFLVFCVYGIIKIPGFIKEYHGLDFKWLWLENPTLDQDYVYQTKDLTFYLGYALYSVSFLCIILFQVSLFASHFTYLKQEEKGEDNA